MTSSNPDLDFEPQGEVRDERLAELVNAIMSTDVGRDRKSVLTSEQALHIARARAFADSFIEWGVDEKGNPVMTEGPLEIIHTICDYLLDTAVSTGSGRGLKDLTKILSAQLAGANEEDDDISRLRQKVMN